MRQPNVQIVTNGAMIADVASNPVFMEQEYMCSIQAVWTGSPTGNFTIETSCDVGAVDPHTGLPTGINNWDTYTGSTVAAGGAAGSNTFRINVLPDRWVRLKYTHSSGTGTLNARMQAKGV